MVKSSVDARRASFSTAYELTAEMEKEIDELFVRIEKFAASCSDAMDFENKFQNSDLNKEYIDMFTKVAKKCKPKQTSGGNNYVEEKSKGQKVLENIGSDAKYIADDLTMPARRQARMRMDSKLRNTPLGKIEQAHNTFWLLKRLKPKKRANIEDSTEDITENNN